MSNEFVTVRNRVTRKVGEVRRRIAEHAILGKVLEIAPEGSKDFVDLKDLVNASLDKEPETVEDLVALEDFEYDYDTKEEA